MEKRLVSKLGLLRWEDFGFEHTRPTKHPAKPAAKEEEEEDDEVEEAEDSDKEDKEYDVSL